MKLLAMLSALALAAPAPAQPAAAQPINIGTSHSIQSEPLGEQRTFNVVLPASYASEPDRRYPVLYLIDGGVGQDLLHVAGVAHLGALWGRSGEAIVVGIETKDRRRELTGPTADAELLKRYPTAGSSAAFRRFIAQEVKPLVERNYRTNDDDAVLGESLAGLFVVETWLDQPALFDSYAAIDPSLWWDQEALSRRAAVGAAQAQKPLYVAVAKEQIERPAAAERLAGKVRAANARWCYAEHPELLHATIYQQLSPQALQFLLPPAETPPAEYGFEVQCSPRS